VFDECLFAAENSFFWPLFDFSSVRQLLLLEHACLGGIQFDIQTPAICLAESLFCNL